MDIDDVDEDLKALKAWSNGNLEKVNLKVSDSVQEGKKSKGKRQRGSIEKYEEAKRLKLAKLEEQRLAIDDTKPFNPYPDFKKNISTGIWIPHRKVVKMEKFVGNFWKLYGFSENRQDLLYPDEALLLVESGLLVIHFNNNKLTLQEFYTIVIEILTIPCYLAFIKLQVVVICKVLIYSKSCFCRNCIMWFNVIQISQ